MHIGVITVRDRTYHPTRRFIEAAGDKGHRVSLIHPYHRWPVITDGTPSVTGAVIFEMPDVILPRQGAQISRSCMVLVSHFESMGIPLVNGPAAIGLASNQFLTLQALAAAGTSVPDTMFINAAEGARKVPTYPGDYPVVVKEINGRQGSGVVLVKDEADLNQVVAARLDRTRGLLLQKFIPLDGRRDVRVLVIGDKIAGAMRLLPPANEFRANYHLGAIGKAWTLTDKAAAIAVEAARVLGLEIAGVDLIIDPADRVWVIEVNYAPGFKGLEKATGLDIAGQVVDHAARVARDNNRKGSGS